MTLLAGVAVRGAVILLIALAATMALRRSAAATRHLVWTLAMVCVLALPIAMAILPAWRVLPVPSTSLVATPTVARAEDRSLVAPGPADDAAQPAVAASDRAAQPVKAAMDASLADFALALWALISAALLLRIAWGIRAVRRLASEASPADSRWIAILDDVVAGTKLRTRVRLLMSDDVATPMTWGRSLLLLPREAARWSDDRARVVLMHEIAHVRRADWLTHAIAHAAAAIHWFNPLAWIALRAMTRERERACDDYVLSQGARASDYATHLLDIATAGTGAHRLTLAPAMARRSELEGRLVAILSPHPLRTGRLAAPLATLAASIAGAVVAIAAPAPPPPSIASTAAIAALPRTGSSIVAQARDGDDDEQARAERKTVETIAGDLEDDSRDVRERAALRLAMSEDRSAIAPLIAALKDPDDDVREKAALGLGFRSEPSVVEPLLAALTDPSAQVREKAAIGLGFRRLPQVTDALLEAMSDPDSQVREKVVIALGLSGDKRATEAIIAATKDPDAQVREKAISALTVLDNGSAELQDAIRAGIASALRLFGGGLDRAK